MSDNKSYGISIEADTKEAREEIKKLQEDVDKLNDTLADVAYGGSLGFYAGGPIPALAGATAAALRAAVAYGPTHGGRQWEGDPWGWNQLLPPKQTPSPDTNLDAWIEEWQGISEEIETNLSQGLDAAGESGAEAFTSHLGGAAAAFLGLFSPGLQEINSHWQGLAVDMTATTGNFFDRVSAQSAKPPATEGSQRPHRCQSGCGSAQAGAQSRPATHTKLCIKGKWPVFEKPVPGPGPLAAASG